MAAEGVAEEPGAVTLAPGGKAFFSIDYTPCSSGRHNQLGRAFYAEFYAHLTPPFGRQYTGGWRMPGSRQASTTRVSNVTASSGDKRFLFITQGAPLIVR